MKKRLVKPATKQVMVAAYTAESCNGNFGTCGMRW